MMLVDVDDRLLLVYSNEQIDDCLILFSCVSKIS